MNAPAFRMRSEKELMPNVTLSAGAVRVSLTMPVGWIDSLAERVVGLSADAHVQGFRFVRNRTHYHFAVAIRLEETLEECSIPAAQRAGVHPR